jgi:hypothetical protein
LHELRPVFSSVRQLHEITGVPVLGVVNMTWLQRHRAFARRRTLVYASMILALMAIAFVMLAVQEQAAHFVQRFV